MNLFDRTRGDNGDDKVKATDFLVGVLTILGKKKKEKEKIIIVVKGKKMVVAMKKLSNVERVAPGSIHEFVKI